STRCSDEPVRRVSPARLESRYETVSQLHGLRSTLARTPGIGGLPRACALGIGRVRAERSRPVAAAMGCIPVRRSAAGGGTLLLAARMEFHVARLGCLLRRCCAGRAGAAPPS